MRADGYDFVLTINPGETPTIRARLEKDGTPYTQSTVSSIAYDLVRLSDETYIRDTTLTVSAVIFNTLQTWPDEGDPPDSEGYNFQHRPTGSDFASGEEYEARYTVTDTAGVVSVMRVKIDVNSVP